LPPESSPVEHVSREVAISVATLERTLALPSPCRPLKRKCLRDVD
jgi:hypothetical protein